MLTRKELHYRVTSPLFLGGPEPRQRIGEEQDASRVKGETRLRFRPILHMWRHWLRAALGARLGTGPDALRAIHKQEQSLFGGVYENGGETASAAAFRVRLLNQRLRHEQFTERNEDRRSWASYLGYGLGSQKRKGVLEQHARWAIAPGSEFVIEIVCPDEVWPVLNALNYLWVNLGGLGARNRRGLGCIECLSAADPPLPQNPGAIGEKARLIGSACVGGAAQAEIRTPPEIEILHPAWFQAKVIRRPFDSWSDALTAIRQQLRLDQHPPAGNLHLGEDGYGWRQGPGRHHEWTPSYRNNFSYFSSLDKPGAAAALRGARDQELKNPLFGLPVAYSTWKMTVNAVLDSGELRRPSPISFRVFREGSRHKVAVTYARSRFLPKGARVAATVKQKNVPLKLPKTWDHLEQFFGALDGDEVRL
jgi:CRISPR/Cas system CMR-associated protein Cmr1 (group 7 of RAMP superfamily)